MGESTRNLLTLIENWIIFIYNDGCWIPVQYFFHLLSQIIWSAVRPGNWNAFIAVLMHSFLQHWYSFLNSLKLLLFSNLLINLFCCCSWIAFLCDVGPEEDILWFRKNLGSFSHKVFINSLTYFGKLYEVLSLYGVLVFFLR